MTAKVYDSIGKFIRSKLLTDQITPLDFSDYAPGLYMLVLEGQHGHTTHKVIRQ